MCFREILSIPMCIMNVREFRIFILFIDDSTEDMFQSGSYHILGLDFFQSLILPLQVRSKKINDTRSYADTCN